MPDNPNITPDDSSIPDEDSPEQPTPPDPGYARIPAPPWGLQPWGIPRPNIFPEDR